MPYGIYVSDDLENDSPTDFRLNSDYGFFMVGFAGTVTVSLDGNGNGSATIPHNLGYAPGYMVYRKGTALWNYLDTNSHANAYAPIGGSNHWMQNADADVGFFAYTDSTNLYIQVISGMGKLGTANVTFKYYIFVDKIQEFSGQADPNLVTQLGLRVAETGQSVLTASLHKLFVDSQYKIIQYQPVNIRSGSITLPAMFSSYVDQDQEEGSYIDFFHGLSYPPMFLAWYSTDNSNFKEIPYSSFTNVSKGGEEPYLDYVTYEVAAFADASKVRISFWRRSIYDIENMAPADIFSAQTIYLKVFMFSENMAV